MSFEFLVSLFLQISISGSVSGVMYLFSLLWGGPQYCALTAAYGIAIFFVNYIFLKKSRSLKGIFYLNLLAGAAATASRVLWMETFNVKSLLVAAAAALLLTLNAVVSNLKQQRLNIITLGLEAAVIVSVICAFAAMSEEVSALLMIPCAVGIIFSLLALALKRMGRVPKLRDAALLGAIVGIVLVISGAFVILAARPAGNALIYLAKVVKTGAQVAWKYIVVFANWIADLSKSDAGAAGSISASISAAIEADTDIDQSTVSFAVPVFIAFAVILIAAVIIVIKLIGRSKVKSSLTGGAGSRNVKRERIGFGAAIRRIIDKIRLETAKRRFLRENAGSPLGIYYGMEERLKRSCGRRKTGESPREYLGRLSAMAPEYEADLTKLVPAVESVMYAGKDVGFEGAAGAFDDKFYKTIKRQKNGR